MQLFMQLYYCHSPGSIFRVNLIYKFVKEVSAAFKNSLIYRGNFSPCLTIQIKATEHYFQAEVIYTVKKHGFDNYKQS